ncbi:sensor histidine kinase [Falsirhodobacter xinxiangensis]|uniref:sensor histidine kinase n=1 Tax=Falsirhodobacter xinxiangensis TaxID=2530049 RepID=UPI0010AA0C80|nr:histidine kinase N-terminal 7TM domain-containing protein [Rhodobacter xinxiangensis]
MMACLTLSPPDAPVVLTLAIMAGQLALARVVRSQPYFFGKEYFIIGMITSIFWLGTSAMELMSVMLDCKMFWAKASWPAIQLVPMTWAMFLADYAFGEPARKPGWRRAVLIAAPLLVALAVVTNGWHQAFYTSDTRLGLANGRISAIYTYGVLFYIACASSYAFLGAGVMVAIAGAMRAHRRYRAFFLAMLSITALPVAGNVAYLAGGFTIYGVDPTPFLFATSLMIIAWMVLNNQMMDINAIAKDLLFYNTSDPIVVIDVHGCLAGANPEAQRMFADLPPVGGDVTRVRVLGHCVADVLQRKGAITGRAMQVDMRHFDLRITPVEKPLDHARARMGWVLSMIDVTERRYLTAALLAERDYLSTLMETSMSGIVAMDADGRVVFANREAERIMQATLPELRALSYSDPILEVVHIDDGTDLITIDQLNVALAEGRKIRAHRSSFVRPDGTRRVISCNVAPLNNPGMEAKIVVSLDDITESYAAEEELRAAVERAEAASRAKSRFLANMGHEIRTPLNGVLGMADLLDRSVSDPDHRRKLDTIRRSGEMLLNILNDLLDMSKIEAGKLPLNIEPFRPDALAARVEELHIHRAEAKGLAFDVFTSGAADRPRLGDQQRVMQIMQNLVSNAVKFTEEGEVSVTFACPPGGPLVIEVADTGIGMTGEQAARIFDEFEQADGSTTRRFGGTGLGMSIVRGLVEMMEGSIALDTVPDRGTTVRVVLPLAEVA